MKKYFITGTDTEVGKTVATTAFLQAAARAGHKNGRLGGLGGRERLLLLEKHYARRNGILPLNYRLVYGVLQVEELIPR